MPTIMPVGAAHDNTQSVSLTEGHSSSTLRAVKERLQAKINSMGGGVNSAGATISARMVSDPVQTKKPEEELLEDPTLAAIATLDESAPEAPILEVPKEEALSPKFAALARREREITRRMQQFAAEKKAWEDQKSQSAQPAFNPADYLSRADLEKDLVGSLNKFGYNPDKVVERLASGQDPYSQKIQGLEAKIAELEGKTTQFSTQAEERQKRDYDQAVNQIRHDAAAVIAKDPAYETIKESGSVEAVVKLIEKTFEESGRIISIEEAASQVEEYLIEESLKVANYSKIKARLTPPPTEAPAPQLGAQKSGYQVSSHSKPQTQPLRTLTNAATAMTSKPRNEAERRARAIAIAKGQKLT